MGASTNDNNENDALNIKDWHRKYFNFTGILNVQMAFICEGTLTVQSKFF